MNTNKTNWLAILATVVAGMALGFLWYGNLFLDQWMAGNGITKGSTDQSMIKDGVEHTMSFAPMAYNVIGLIIYGLFMNWLLNKTQSKNLMGGLKLGAFIGLIMLIGIFIGNTYALNPLSLTIVDGAYTFILWTIIGAVIGGLKGKNG